MGGGWEGLVLVVVVGIFNFAFYVAAVVGGLYVWEKWVKPKLSAL